MTQCLKAYQDSATRPSSGNSKTRADPAQINFVSRTILSPFVLETIPNPYRGNEVLKSVSSIRGAIILNAGSGHCLHQKISTYSNFYSLNRLWVCDMNTLKYTFRFLRQPIIYNKCWNFDCFRKRFSYKSQGSICRGGKYLLHRT